MRMSGGSVKGDRRQLKKRQWGQAIRLEVEAGIDKRLLAIVKKELSIEEEDIFRIDGPLDLTFLMKMYGLSGFEHLKAENTSRSPCRSSWERALCSTRSGRGISCCIIPTSL